ncbi:MAG: ParB/RepB/Spo0J family partition protein [Candidatus Gorgyraea atricola]|nr:ParB/RepB/Spo0J family partition protein [Candidatus Gorgyraea atricola]
MEKRGLGRGLEALISGTPNHSLRSGTGQARDVGATTLLKAGKGQAVVNVPLGKIKANKYQPRGDFDKQALEDLANSIKEKGFVQPILVRDVEGEYELVAGERRFRAAQKLNLKEIPAIVKDVSDLDSLELSIIENVQREDLNPIDQAKAYKRLLDEFDMTQEKVSDTIGKDRTTVTNILRLLKLPKKIQDHVSRGTISMGHARAMLSLPTENEQNRLCTKVLKNDLSVRDTERYAKKMSVHSKKKVSEKDPNLLSLEEELRDALGTKVRILKGKRGGKIEIEFYSDTDLEKVVTRLKSKS